MGRNVADLMWEMLEKAGVERCYGIVGDALNPVVDALRRNGHIEFVHVRHEEYGVFAAGADAYFTGKPVVVCGTAGAGVWAPRPRTTSTTYGGEGCRDAHDEVINLAAKLKAPVGYSFRGKQWLEHDNPYAVGMTGLLGYGGAYKAIHEADLLLLLGTDFPFPEFLPNGNVKKVQIDRNAKHLGRRTALDLALVGDVKSTLASLLPKIAERKDPRFLEKPLGETRDFEDLLTHYVEKGPGIKPIRPEFLAATLSDLAAPDAMFFVDPGTACIWAARHIKGGNKRRIFGSFSWGSMANAAPNAFVAH